ncbi:MAG: VWA domain-containing protein [Chloroflexales bacterium]|nr:VWA domain-containing protein [Chloroflexales bacterium]
MLVGNRFRETADPNDSGELSGNLRGLTWRRLTLRSGGLDGDIAWLRWRQNSEPSDLAASMIAPGNLGQGFDEAGWPNISQARPDGYPERPAQLNAGDWVNGFSTSGSANVGGLISGHITKGTVMILPIYDGERTIGSSADAKYLITGFGAFVIQGYNENPGAQPTFDLAYLGDPNNFAACTTSPVDRETLSVAGPVEFWPEYSSTPQRQLPVQYVVVLDTSGSMNFSFDGKGKLPGTNTDAQCANSDDPVTNANRLEGGCVPNHTYAWQPQEERRIYVAKDALNLLIDMMNLPANPDYNDSRPPDQMSIITFNAGASDASSWSDESGELKEAVRKAGMHQDNSYWTATAGTNGAAGLFRASQLLQSTPDRFEYNGEEFEYKRVIIFITDGVSNQFFDRGNNATLGAGTSDEDTYPSNHWCREDPNVVENAVCMTNDGGGGTYTIGEKTFDRPITAMGKVSTEFLHPAGFEVYVVALSGIPAAGLKSTVATDEHYYAEATELISSGVENNVRDIFRRIHTQIERGDCVVNGAGSEWVNRIFDDNAPPGYPKVGEVFLTNEHGQIFPTSIMANANNGEEGYGTLSFSLSNLPKGTYNVQAYVRYVHDIDRVVRQYDQIYDGGTLQIGEVQSLNGVIQHSIKLKLAGNVCAVGD